MSNVIDLNSRRPVVWMSGPMICTACKHEWQGTCKEGEKSGFDCPECGSGMGILKYPVIPDVAWQCKCGGMLFYLTMEAPCCRECGAPAKGWAEC